MAKRQPKVKLPTDRDTPKEVPADLASQPQTTDEAQADQPTVGEMPAVDEIQGGSLRTDIPAKEAAEVLKVKDTPPRSKRVVKVFEEVGSYTGVPKLSYPLPTGPDIKEIDGRVFPSEEKTVRVVDDADYGGAHTYHLQNCLGFNGGKTQYQSEGQAIQFIQKNEDGSVIPGLQSEQLVLMLIDRHKKLNRKFPSEQYYKMLQGLNLFLEACQERVEERIKKGVMGELKK